jgi:hypothetical protein
MNRRIMKISPFLLLVLMGHVCFPLLFIFQMRSISQHNLLEWILSLYTAISYTAFIYVAGAWSWFGNATRLALPMILAVVAVITFPYEHPELNVSTVWSVDPLLSFCVGMVFTTLFVQALLGRRMSTSALELAFPLNGGTYYVAQGGSTQIINIHRKSTSQRYALDLLKLGKIGLRAAGFYPADPKKYSIFGADVVSPCDGVIRAAEDGFIDYSPPERDPEHRPGNFVALECNGATIYLAHLMNGSIRVKAGEPVRKGQILGRVGNSGNTTEPHLHIHAEEGPYPGEFSGKRGVPIQFEGRFLVRNDRVTMPG